MRFTDLFVKRPVLAIVVNLVILIAGLQSIRSLSVRQYPRSDIAVVRVTTVYVGANADLVRGISDALSLRRLAVTERPSRLTYEDLVAAVTRAIDAHYWLGHVEAGDLLSTLQSMKKTSEPVTSARSVRPE